MAELMEGYLREKNIRHYEKSFLAIARNHSAKKTFNLDDSQFQSLIMQRLPNAEEICLLSFGSGTGENEFEMLKKLLRNYKSIRATFVDPSADFNSKFKSLVMSKQNELQGVTCTWQEEPIEEFLQRCESQDKDTRFHLISSIYAMFYVKEASEVLLSLYKRLAVGGLLVNIMPADNVTMAKFRTHFVDEFFPADTMSTGTGLAETFRRAGIPYTVETLKDTVDITSCFDDESKEGSLLLDFITQSEDLRKQVSSEELKNVLRVLKRYSQEMPDGRVLSINDKDVVIVQRMA